MNNKMVLFNSEKLFKIIKEFKSIIYILLAALSISLIYLFKEPSKNIPLAILEIVIGFGLGITALSNINNVEIDPRINPLISIKNDIKLLYKYMTTHFAFISIAIYFIALNGYSNKSGNIVISLIGVVVLVLSSLITGYIRRKFLHLNKSELKRNLISILNVVVTIFVISPASCTDLKILFAYSLSFILVSYFQFLVGGFIYDIKHLCK